MLKNFAIIFGVIMLVVGALGFVPQANPNGLLLGLFHVNTIHNLVHIATGIVAILCGLSNESASRVYFQVFGIVYGLVALLGYYYMDRPIFGLLANNLADAILHTLIAAVSLYLGFAYRHLPTNYPHDQNRNV